MGEGYQDRPDGQESFLDSYCREFKQLAETLVDLLDVAARRNSDRPIDDTGPLLSLVPVLERLQAHVARYRPYADALSQPAVSEKSIEDLTSAAVETSVAAELGAKILTSANAMIEWITASSEEVAELADNPALGEEVSVPKRPAPLIEPEKPMPEAKVVPPEEVTHDRLLEVLMEEVGQRSTLQGTSSSMPVAALFQLLAGSRLSGCLNLRSPKELMRFVLDEGVIVSTATTNPPPGQRLGDLLVEMGLIDRQCIQAKAAEARSEAKSLGAVLVEQRLVSVADVKRALKKQVQSRFDRILQEEFVAYAFVPDRRKGIDGRIRAKPGELMLQWAHRVDEQNRSPDDLD